MQKNEFDFRNFSKKGRMDIFVHAAKNIILTARNLGSRRLRLAYTDDIVLFPI